MIEIIAFLVGYICIGIEFSSPQEDTKKDANFFVFRIIVIVIWPLIFCFLIFKILKSK